MRSKLINTPVRTPLRAALIAGAVTIGLTAMSGTSWAGPTVTVNSVGDSFSTQFTALYSSTVTASANAIFKVLTFGADQATFDVTVTNTTPGDSSLGDVRFTNFGWDTIPVTSGGSTTANGGVYSTVVTNTTLSSVHVDVCLVAGTNCNGGANGGLDDQANAGTSGSDKTDFTLTLNFSSSVPPITFSGFRGKFQAYQPLGSLEPDGVMTGGNGTFVSAPEPGSLALLGTGLIGLGLVMRRRRRRG